MDRDCGVRVMVSSRARSRQRGCADNRQLKVARRLLAFTALPSLAGIVGCDNDVSVVQRRALPRLNSTSYVFELPIDALP